MNRTMFLLTLFVCVFFLIIPTSSSVAQAADEYWSDFVSRNVKDADVVSFELSVRYKSKYADTTVRGLFVRCDRGNTYLSSGDRYQFRMNADTAWLADYQSGNFSFAPKQYEWTGLNWYDQIVNRYLKELNIYAPFYITLGDDNLPGAAESISDTVIAGKTFRIIRMNKLTGMRYNEATEDFDIPVVKTIKIYCNDRRGLVERIDVIDTSAVSAFYYFDNITIGSANHSDSHILNGRNHDMQVLDTFNLTKAIPFSEMGRLSDDTTMTDGFLSTPLVSAYGDTVRLKDDNGWKLLEFWIFGCKPCALFLSSLQAEMQTLGYRTLEKEGISIYCINNTCGVTPKFKEYAERFDAGDIVFSAKNRDVLQITAFPTYYLFSPENELVFRGADTNIIDKIVGLKKEYEKKHPVPKKMTHSPAIRFQEKEHDYGTLKTGADGTCRFVFTNTGNAQLVIDHVSTSCGCTVAEFPKQPVAPGKTGVIKVAYDTTTPGSFRKTVVVVSNASNAHKTVLHIRGNVLAQP